MPYKKSLFKELIQQRYSYLFIAPTIILFMVFVLIPVIASFFLSFTRYNILSAPQWVGWDNYRQIFFHDPRFWKALKNTALYVIGVVPLGISISLLLAVAIDQKIRFKNFYQAVFFMPVVTSVIAVSVVWKWLFAGGKYGLINYWLLKLGINPVDWLMSPTWTLPAIMIMSIWAGLGYNMILLLTGLQTIPRTFYEAADIDGAGAWPHLRQRPHRPDRAGLHRRRPHLRPLLALKLLRCPGSAHIHHVGEEVPPVPGDVGLESPARYREADGVYAGAGINLYR